jgi:Mrp family chromosome partitioning ATPase
MIDKLEKVNAKLLGIVINNYDRKNYYRQFGAGKTGRYYSKYGYGIESDARNK